MAKAKNKVIDGDYRGKDIYSNVECAEIQLSFGKKILLDSSTILSYDVTHEDHEKSATSGVAKSLVGNFFLGPVGAIAGAVSGKTVGVYTMAINFKDGKRSLIEVDDKIYQQIVQKMSLSMNRPQTSETASPQYQPSAPAIVTPADEIMKYKQLYDQGAISKKEYEKKKKELLKK